MRGGGDGWRKGPLIEAARGTHDPVQKIAVREFSELFLS